MKKLKKTLKHQLVQDVFFNYNVILTNEFNKVRDTHHLCKSSLSKMNFSVRKFKASTKYLKVLSQTPRKFLKNTNNIFFITKQKAFYSKSTFERFYFENRPLSFFSKNCVSLLFLFLAFQKSQKNY